MRLDNTTQPRVATELKIGFLSAVDMPAHEGAQAVVLKARMTEKGTMTTEQLMKSVFTDALMETKVEQNLCDLLWQKVWPVNDALKEAAENIVKDDTITDKQAAMRQIISEYVAEVSRVLNETDVFKSNPQQEADMADEKQLAKFKALAAMSDVQKAHHAKLDEQGQAEFEAMSSEDRDAVVKALHVEDETFVGDDGVTVSKAAVGAAAFSVMKSQHLQISNLREQADLTRLAKQAESDLSHLPGEVVLKAKVLKSIERMPQAERDALTAMLKAGDAASAAGFVPAAKAGEATPEAAEATLEAMVTKHMAEHKVTKSAALKAVYASEEGRALLEEIQ